MIESPTAPKSFTCHHKDREKILQSIRNRIEIATGKSISQLKSEHAEHSLFFFALQYVTTTKKALCEALDIPVEGACRYKRSAEKGDFLVQSTDKFTCPFTGRLAHKISTNPAEFNNLRQTVDTQLSLPNF